MTTIQEKPAGTGEEAPTARPMTGDEYIQSIRDDREIWIYGERVKDVTEHPAFRNPVRMTARLYDALHDPARQDKLLVPTDTGSGGRTHPFFRTPHSSADLLADKQAIETWARMTWGWMGRSPDYKASFLGTLGGNTEFYAPFEENAKRWYKESQEKVLYWNHAIINPPVDRNLPPDEAGEVFMRVEKETDAGVIVSGAKVVATGSAITNYNIYRGTASNGETLLATVGNITSYDDSGLTNGATYYYKVSAVNAIGEGLLSNEVSATPHLRICGSARHVQDCVRVLWLGLQGPDGLTGGDGQQIHLATSGL